MNVDDLFEEVESLEFATRITILSGFRILLVVLSKDETLSQLKRHLQEHPAQKRQFLSRLLELLPKNDHPEYMHPFDPTITAYLYVLNSVEPGLAHIAIDQIMDTPNLFWAYRLAQYLRELGHTQFNQIEIRTDKFNHLDTVMVSFDSSADHQHNLFILDKSVDRLEIIPLSKFSSDTRIFDMPLVS